LDVRMERCRVALESAAFNAGGKNFFARPAPWVEEIHQGHKLINPVFHGELPLEGDAGSGWFCLTLAS